VKLRFTKEWLAKHLAEDGDIPACPHCGAMAGACLDYPNCPMGNQQKTAMTTIVKVHVNGKYRATVTQDDREPVIVEGNYNGGSGEKSFYLPHPAKGTFVVSEEYVKDGDERPAG